MDAALVTKMIFGMIGGLGIFLLGMKNMSEGMQAVAGHKLRRMINAVTNNRLVACGIGAFITSLIQSSSVTSVMAVGMVNASLMSLGQAIGVILGANIGTTITAWILTLEIGKYGLPILGLGALFFLFSKRDQVRYTAMLVLGLGMIFFGLELMKNGFAPLRDVPQFSAWLERFTPDSYLGVLKCCLVGAAITAIMQSSSATVGMTIGAAAAGVINFPTAAALVLGENIGTTITAYLASLGASANAKRASFAHIIVNVGGVAWITALFPFYIGLVKLIVGMNPDTDIVAPDGGAITAAIAMSHTVFNVVNVAVFLPLVPLLARLLQWVVPEKAHKETPHLTYLNVRMLDTPAIGIEQSMKEILYMAQGVEGMLERLKRVILDQESDPSAERKIFRREEILDFIQKEIFEFLNNLLSGNVPHHVMEHGRRQLRMADEYESISDYIASILKLNLKMRNTGLEMGGQGKVEILDLHTHVADYVRFVNDAVRQEDTEIFDQSHAQAEEITRLMKDYRARHLARVETGAATPLKSLIFTDMLNDYRRIKDHALNIAEVVAGEK